MGSLASSAQLYRLGGLIALIAVAAIARAAWRWWQTRDEREIELRLRTALDTGDLRAAGDIQMDRGLYLEASRIYQRAGDHARTGRALSKLGDDKAAAAAFDKAEDFANAAPLYFRTGNNARAGQLFEKVREYEMAAAAYAKVDKLEPRDHALTMLENAALACTESARKKNLWLLAGAEGQRLAEHERAARGYDRGGDLARAAELYEQALGEFAVAAALHEELGNTTDATRLTVAAGGTLPVLKLRETRARERGDAALVKTLVGAIGMLAPKSDAVTVVAPSGHGALSEKPAENRFELLGELGRGGMGVVHRARDKKLGRLVALKFLPDDVELSTFLVSVFRREARAAAALNHPGIVTVYDVGTVDGKEYIAMELVEGTTLDRILEQRGPIPAMESIETMEPVLEAVHYAHSQSVIHRDLKPSNIMKTRTGAKVMDFGLAKVVGAQRTTGLSKQTVIGGTPVYMPPEQLTGDADHRSDVFALGATWYEVLTGTHPGRDGQVANASVGYPSPRERVPTVPARLSDLVMLCLEHDPVQRPQDVGEILREARAIRASVESAMKARAIVPEVAKPKRAIEVSPPSVAPESAVPRSVRGGAPRARIPREDPE